MADKSRKNGFFIGIIMIWIACIPLTICFAGPWIESNLNVEFGANPLPGYSDINTTLVLTPMDSRYGQPNDIIESNYSSSNHITRIKMNWSTYYTQLNICYMEVLVYNSTNRLVTNQWFLNLTSGIQNESYWLDPHTVYVPAQPAKSQILFKIRLLSSDSNKVYVTPTNLNNMTFSYQVEYSTEELAIDSQERNNAGLLIWGILILSPILIIIGYKYTDNSSVTSTADYKIPDTSKIKAESWISFLTGRIDSLDNVRHQLVIESQILIAILGSVYAFFAAESSLWFIASLIVILALPLFLSIIALMAGAGDIEMAFDLSQKETIRLLIESAVRKLQFVRKSRRLIFLGSYYAITMTLAFLFAPYAVYHYLLLLTLTIIFLSIILGIIYTSAALTYRNMTNTTEPN